MSTELTYQDELRAKAQTELAKLLLAREKLVDATKSPDAAVSTRATQLLVRQDELEGRVAEAGKIIVDLKNKNVSYIAYLPYAPNIVSTFYDVEQHIKDVDRLTKGILSRSTSLSPIVSVGLIAVLVVIVAKILSTKGR